MLRVSITALGRLFRSRNGRGRATDPLTEEEAEQEMGFFEHLEELRQTIIRCILVFTFAMIGAFCFSKQIFAFMRQPLEKAAGHESLLADPTPNADPLATLSDLGRLVFYGEPATAAATVQGALNPSSDALTTLKFMDVFSILLNIGLVGGLAFAGPFILYFGSRFIAPALTDKEKKGIIPFCVSTFFLFAAGCLFSFFWLIPISIEVMHHFNQMFGLRLTWIASDYYSFVVMMTLIVGVAFEFPLVVIILQYLEVIKTATLLRLWRHVLVGILVGSLLITPLGDPVSLSVLTGILFLLYLLAVSIGGGLLRLKHRKQRREEENYEQEYAEYQRQRSEKKAREKTAKETTPALEAPLRSVPASEKTPDSGPKDTGDLTFLDDE